MQKKLFSTSNLKNNLKSLQGTNFQHIGLLTPVELEALIEQAIHYKEIYKHQKNHAFQPLAGENVAMIFQKRSTRTRTSTEVGMKKLGGDALFLSSDDIQLGVNESLKDSAKVLSRFASLILARVYAHDDILTLNNEATVPVINALSDKYHPLQTLADYMTVKEHFGYWKGLTFCWVGDGNNVLHDLMLGAPKLGMNVRIATPKGYEPDSDVISQAQVFAKEAGTEILLTNDPKEAVRNANIISTDTWISMGEESEAERKLKDFAGYQITNQLMDLAEENCVFLHCLPRHKEEVDDQVFYSPKSLVFDEAENRMWTVMAVMSALLGRI